jgi:hypothetical protein
VHLEPATYLCPIHQVDLTDLVRRQLEDVNDVDVAFGGRTWGLARRSDRAAPRPFQVQVSCPAAGSRHGQVCEGTYTP